MESLTGLDAAFLSFETPNAPLHVGAVIVFDPPPGKQLLFSESARFGFVRRLIEQRIHLVPPFRRRAVGVPFGLGQPVWIEDPELDLDAHVKRARLPSPGGPAELTEFVADLLARPLDRSRPLWEMVITEGLEGGRSALVVKLHHAILDGVSAASLLGTFLDLGPRPREVDPPEVSWQPESVPTVTALVKRAVGAAVHDPGLALGTVNRSLRMVTELADHNRRLVSGGAALPPAPFNAPRTSLNGSVSTRRSFGMASLSLAEVKARREGVRSDGERCRARDRRRGSQESPRSARRDARVGACRDGARVDQGACAWCAGDRDAPTLGNKVSAMLVSLATTIDDPVERLTSGVGEQSRREDAHGCARREDHRRLGTADRSGSVDARGAPAFESSGVRSRLRRCST